MTHRSLRQIGLAAGLLTLPAAAQPAPGIPTPPADPQALGRALSALPGLAACVTTTTPDPACVRRQIDQLPAGQKAALAAFVAFTAFYAEHTGGDEQGDWPPGPAGLPQAGQEHFSGEPWRSPPGPAITLFDRGPQE